MKNAFLAALVVVPLTACDPLFFVEVEERRICLEQTQTIPPAPPVGPQNVTWESVLDLSDGIPGLENGAVTGDILVLGARVTGTTSLQGVSSAEFAVHTNGRPDARIASYERPAVLQDPNTLDFEGSPQVNLLDYLDSSTITYRVELAGAPPTAPWDGAVELCLSMKVTVDVIQAAQE